MENKHEGNLKVGMKPTGKGRIEFEMQFDDNCTYSFEMSVDQALDLARAIADRCKDELELQLFAEMFKF